MYELTTELSSADKLKGLDRLGRPTLAKMTHTACAASYYCLVNKCSKQTAVLYSVQMLPPLARRYTYMSSVRAKCDDVD